MNPPAHEHPALTAYALGELAPAEAATIERMIATSPEVRAEYERIALAVAALRREAALPRRGLHPRQRETVLAMGQAPARGPRVVPFVRPAVSAPHAAWGVLKFAAAASLAVGAFIAGRHFAPRGDAEIAARPEPATGSPVPAVVAAPAQGAVGSQAPAAAPRSAPVAPVAGASAVAPPRPSPPAAPAVVVRAPDPVPAALPPSAPPVAGVPVPSAPAAPAVPPPAAAVLAQRPAASGSSRLPGFQLAQAQPETVIALQPRLMRAAPKPVPREFAGQLLAAPLPEKPRTAARPGAPSRPEPQPPLVIHSWKAEIASCPWNTSHRLMRFVAQIPVEQEGVEANARDYEIAVKFDPAQVQGWRQITEKHMPPTGGGTLATRFVWYEIVPGRNFAPTREKPAALGALDIIQPRGAPRDSQPLRLLDRGLRWNEAREDFVFETAMIGFNLLLQGAESTGSLNHRLVLEIAEQSAGEDPRGERARFIGIVRQAEKAAGL